MSDYPLHCGAPDAAAAREGRAQESVSDPYVEALFDVLVARCGGSALNEKQHQQVFAPGAVLHFGVDEVAALKRKLALSSMRILPT